MERKGVSAAVEKKVLSPKKVPPKTKVTQPPPEEPLHGPEEPFEPKVNILMVDDTPENLVALEAVLSDLGQNLVKARSGEEALRLILKQDFAVILLDVNMPGMNGFETAAMIRQRKNSEHTPIIFVSAISTSDTHLFKGYSLGAVDYIFTPVIADVLRSKVSVFVELLKKTEESKRSAEKLRQVEEREHKRRLEEAAERLEFEAKRNRFFSLSIELIGIAGYDGFFKQLNPTWEQVLGFPESEMRRQPLLEFVHPEDRADIEQKLQSLLKKSAPAVFECRFCSKDGGYRWLSWTVVSYPAEELLYLFARDITDKKASEEEIQKLNAALGQRARELENKNAELQSEVAFRAKAEEALQESNSALEAFSYSVSHDLRAPLRAMQGFAKVLLEDYGTQLDEMGRECADRIVTASERMDCLIQDLLIYSRLGHTTLDLKHISLDGIIEDVLSQLVTELREKGANVSVVKPLPGVLAHTVTLTQVLLNLISNALKFVPPGRYPVIKIFAETEDGFVKLWICDNGIGIKPEDHSRIFRVFERLTGSDSFPGTGLGLAIVRKGIERMGGQVGVESSLGEGSKFWLRLKLSQATP